MWQKDNKAMTTNVPRVVEVATIKKLTLQKLWRLEK